MQGFPLEESLSKKILKRSTFAHVAGDPASVDTLKKAGIANAQVGLILRKHWQRVLQSCCPDLAGT